MANFWRIFGEFLRPVFTASRIQQISDMHSKFALRHIMCGSTVDTQSATAENRRAKERRKKVYERRNHKTTT